MNVLQEVQTFARTRIQIQTNNKSDQMTVLPPKGSGIWFQTHGFRRRSELSE
jgi:hypothetical protein